MTIDSTTLKETHSIPFSHYVHALVEREKGGFSDEHAENIDKTKGRLCQVKNG